MDWDERVQQFHEDEARLWFYKFSKARNSEIAAWVSKYRGGKLCVIVEDRSGSYNWSCKVRFDDGIQWLVRFAVPGRAMNRDEKVQNEVTVLRFLKEYTSIPIAGVIAFGVSAENTLDLGPFIIMEFVEGMPLGTFLEGPRSPPSRPILRPDIDPGDLEIIYRQIARIQLELSRHDFSQIGSLVKVNDQYVPQARPLTIKMNEIESHSGIKVGCPKPTTFSSAIEYFQHVADQDFQHLHAQPNSIDDEEDARSKFLFRKQFQTVVQRFVSAEHNLGPFKLFCEDFRFGNILVNNYKDLQIVAVVDWEWSWAAPYQMLYSPPRWLLLKPPIDWDEDERPELMNRYMSSFQIFIRIFEEEESTMKCTRVGANQKMSSLMRAAMQDGKLWFHELILSSFEGPKNIAWTAIQEQLHLQMTLESEAEACSFVKQKMHERQEYTKQWDIVRQERESLLKELRANRNRE